MPKGDMTKTVLIAGGIGLAVYMLSRQGITEKIKEAVASLASGIGGGGGGLPSIQMPSIQLPQFSMPQLQIPAADLTGGLQDLLGGINTQAGIGGLGDLLTGINDALKGTDKSAVQPTEHATVLDTVYSMPSWAKGMIGVSAGLLGGYGGYQVIKASAPLLKQVGIQAAKATGGVGGWLSKLFKGSTIASMGISSTSFFSPMMPILGFTLDPQAMDLFNKLLHWIGLPTPLYKPATAAEGGSPATVAPSTGAYYGGGSANFFNNSWCGEVYGAREPAEVQPISIKTSQGIKKLSFAPEPGVIIPSEQPAKRVAGSRQLQILPI